MVVSFDSLRVERQPSHCEVANPVPKASTTLIKTTQHHGIPTLITLCPNHGISIGLDDSKRFDYDYLGIIGDIVHHLQ